MGNIPPLLEFSPEYAVDVLGAEEVTAGALTGYDALYMPGGYSSVAYQTLGEGGRVTRQLPGTGAMIATGSSVLLYTDVEPSEELEEMPDLSYLTYRDARDVLAGMGLFVSTSSSVTSPETQSVLSQNIPEGTEVEHGTVVKVTLVTTDTNMLGQY